MKAVKEVEEGLLVDIDVVTNANKFQISGYNDWRQRIEISVKSLPQKGKANKEIEKEMSKFFSRDVKIVSGLKSRHKSIIIYGINLEEFLENMCSFL